MIMPPVLLHQLLREQLVTTGDRRCAAVQEHARDSYENLLFSICRFREVTGHYPQTIVVRQVDQRTIYHYSAPPDVWNPSGVPERGHD